MVWNGCSIDVPIQDAIPRRGLARMLALRLVQVLSSDVRASCVVLVEVSFRLVLHFWPFLLFGLV